MIVTVRLESGQTQSVNFVDALIIGRAHDCGLVLDDDQVSQHHAVLRSGASGVTVEDLKSTNGTFVNGDRIASVAALRGGEEVRVGQTVLLVPAVDQEVAGTVSYSAPPTRPSPPPRQGWDSSKTIWLSVVAIVAVIALIGAFLVFGKRMTRPAQSPVANPSAQHAATVTPTFAGTTAPPAGVPIAEGHVEGAFGGGPYGWDFTPKCQNGPCPVVSKVFSEVWHFSYDRSSHLYSATSHFSTKCTGPGLSFQLRTTRQITFRVVKSADVAGMWEAQTLKGDDVMSIHGASKTVGNIRYTCKSRTIRKSWTSRKV